MRKSLRRELRRTQCEHPRRRNPMGRHPCLVELENLPMWSHAERPTSVLGYDGTR